MLIPIRCYTCLSPIDQKWGKYEAMYAQGRKPSDILNRLNVRKICCKKFFPTNVIDLMDTVVMLSEEVESDNAYEQHSTVTEIRSCEPFA